MGIHIESERVERLAQELAQAVGKDIPTAVEEALAAALEEVHRAEDFAARKARVREIVKSFGPVPEGVTSDHSDLYDEWGLPK